MFILKILIGILAIYCSVNIAKCHADKIKNKYYFFKDVCMFCKEYEINLSYDKKDLKLFLNNEYSSVEFDTLLKNFITDGEINDDSIPKFLNDKEVREVVSMLNSLGKSDSKSQLLSITNYYKIFSDIQSEKNLEFKKFYSVYVKIGFSIGLMLLIMVI